MEKVDGVAVLAADVSPARVRPANSRHDAGFFSRWSYTYMNELMRRGIRREIGLDDMPRIEPDDESDRLSSAVLAAWADEVARNGSKASLTHALWAVFGRSLTATSIVYFIEALVQIGQGIMLGQLLQWFQKPNSETKEGCLYAMGLSLCVLAAAILHHVDFFLGMRTGMQMRVALIATIYRKCLSLSVSNTSSTGRIVNLVSNDVQRFEDAAIFGHFAWIGPVQTLLVLYFMYREIGWAAFAAIGALLMLIPIQSAFANQFAKLRKLTVHFRDERIKSISDMLAGIMVVKLYAWENPFVAKITDLRSKEMYEIRKASVYRAINEAIFFVSSTMLELFAFMVFFFIGGSLTASHVFTAITYLQGVRLTMTNFFPKAFQFISEAYISLLRIREFLLLPEMSQSSSKAEADALLGSLGDPDVMVAIKDASFSWGSSDSAASSDAQPDREILSNITLSIKRGELVGVCGPVGAGKSSLINAILGEMTRLDGVVALRSRKIAYAMQTPWIISGSIKDNILFGQPYNAEQFAAALSASALARDLERLPERENTLIGERGVTLSGGQRARLALARALYYDADIYILDDPLSAVDTAVGRHLFEQALRGMLRDKAVLLVTHQLQHIRSCDRIVLLEEGKITRIGTYGEVMAMDTPFAGTMREFAVKSDAEDSSVASLDADAAGDDSASNEISVATGTTDAKDSDPSAVALRRRRQHDKELEAAIEEDAPATREIAKEEVAKGNVEARVYFKYFSSGTNAFITIMMAVVMVLGQAIVVFADWWLSFWSSKSADEQRELRYPLAFFLLCIIAFVIAMTRAIAFFMICLKASEKAFGDMLVSVFRSPMHFFQANPHGRLMNRFSKDISLMDEMLPMTFFDFLQAFFGILGSILMSIIVIPYILIIIPFVMGAFYMLRRYFIATSRQVKRIESLTRSPVYSNIPSTLEGLSTIRAFGAETRIKDSFAHTQNENTRVFFMFLSSSRWLGFRLDLLSAVFLTIITFAAALLRGPLSLAPGLVGLMISYALQLTGTLQWAARQSAEVETLMVSAERVFEYAELPPEAATETDVKPRKHWPEHGDIQINNMSMAYKSLAPGAEDAPVKPVLKDITIHFEAGTKVGIVGRTGAGKSSFLQALFRIVEPTPAGAIVIDGIKTSDLGLTDLRSRISIIPQEPFCFKGTLRFNLDPFGRYEDEHLWRVLEAVELKQTVLSIPEKLEAPVAENGTNWSVGERQLICLARAILRDTRLIVMDEATSAVDMRTDQLIQKAIRSEGGLFSNATVLTIAHRLNTVIDYDRILVLDDGRVVEFGAPYELLDKPADQPDAWFARMVNEMGDEAKEGLIAIANRGRPASTEAAAPAST